MDLGFLFFSVCVMMISPLGDVRCSAGDAIDCPCPAIPPVNLAQPPPETCFQIDSRFRYSCTEGYVRKAGTSNLITCRNTGGVAKWTEAKLQCILDPKIPPSPPGNEGHTDIPPDSTIATTVNAIDCPCPAIPPVNLTQPPPETCFQIDSRFRYSCTEGYVMKEGTSNLITCQNTGGVAKWTEAKLQCILDPKTPPSPPVNEGHTDIPPDSTIATTVTAATTSLQMTQSISTSASVTAETDSTEPTSPGRQVLSVHTQAGKVNVTETIRMAGTTPASTTPVPSQRNTHVHEFTSTIASVSIVSLAIICGCTGISFYCYKRRTKNMIPVRTSDVDVPMDDIQSQNRVCSQPATAVESSRLNGDQDCRV